MRTKVDAEIARLWAAYRDDTAEQRARYPALRVLEAVATAHNITLDELRSLQRHRRYCHARHHAAWELRRRRRDLPLLRVADYIGRTDHTTALHSYHTFAHMVSRGLYQEQRDAVEAALCSSL